ncbi:MAG: Transcriptional regulator, Crp/Fnr family, partial [uncultured Rubrobacteraceae bacterium]
GSLPAGVHQAPGGGVPVAPAAPGGDGHSHGRPDLRARGGRLPAGRVRGRPLRARLRGDEALQALLRQQGGDPQAAQGLGHLRAPGLRGRGPPAGVRRGGNGLRGHEGAQDLRRAGRPPGAPRGVQDHDAPGAAAGPVRGARQVPASPRDRGPPRQPPPDPRPEVRRPPRRRGRHRPPPHPPGPRRDGRLHPRVRDQSPKRDARPRPYRGRSRTHHPQELAGPGRPQRGL